MPNSTFDQLIKSLVGLGIEFGKLAGEENEIKYLASQENPWFTVNHINLALNSWSEALKEDKILKWLDHYPKLKYRLKGLQEGILQEETIGLIMAGNIPLVGFQDLLYTLISGNRALVKLSSQDNRLIPYITENFLEKIKWFSGKTVFTSRLQNLDRVIATGSNNSSRYFDYYFGKYPHIIRKNRNSIAVLTGNESDTELINLGKDIFQYFGLGCRNVSKIMVPEGYDFIHFLKTLEPYRDKLSQSKYLNNVDYQNALLLLNKTPFYQNGFLFLRESNQVASPISVLHYQYYQSQNLKESLLNMEDQIQCLVGSSKLIFEENLLPENFPLSIIPFGKSQEPELWDYADQIDTLKFLLEP